MGGASGRSNVAPEAGLHWPGCLACGGPAAANAAAVLPLLELEMPSQKQPTCQHSAKSHRGRCWDWQTQHCKCLHDPRLLNSDPAALHIVVWKYTQGSSKACAQVLHNLIVCSCAPDHILPGRLMPHSNQAIHALKNRLGHICSEASAAIRAP